MGGRALAGWTDKRAHGKSRTTVTSYDYDVPVSESGELRPKYFAFRDAIREVTGVTPPGPPAALPARALAPVKLKRRCRCGMRCLKRVESEQILSMEDVGQSFGYILYRTTIENAQTGDLKVDEFTATRRFTWMECLRGRWTGG